MKIPFFTRLFLVIFLAPLCSVAFSTHVIPYPAIPELVTSDVYSVEVNGQKIWTEKFTTHFDFAKLPDWFNAPYVRVQQEIHQAGFSCDGPVKISITVPGVISHASVRPASREIKTIISGKTLTFSIHGPDKLFIEIDSLAPLCLFADPPEETAPSPDDPGVHYFGPGVHHPGYITLKDHETLYIAPGAIVYGGIRADSVSDIRVMGRGILDGNFEFERMVRMRNCQNVRVEGVLMRYGNGWTNTLINCRNVEYRGVKVLSFGPGGDGIDPLGSQNVIITKCFLRCTDDCIAIKCPSYDHIVKNILVSDNTMIGFAYSDGITIGYETNGKTISDIAVKNCDILLARGGSRVNGHSGFSIICDGPAVISNVVFENLRVEKAEDRLFELDVTNGTLYGDDPPGHIRDILLKNIHWYHAGPIVLKGFDKTHRVENVIFQDCMVGHSPLKDVKDEVLETNAFVTGITVK